MDYRDNEDFSDFIEYNDVGLPLAYALDNDLITLNDSGIGFINEAFDLLLGALEIEDTGFTNLDEVLEVGGNDSNNNE